ncbi:SARP family transcriptional regulator [Micromonospora sp. 15K316]|uniref:AfsR/SARP family transcriptional regulator n=1 Tax=Micromonospora sp. 15K316 TaxID=2530376 RepID=UPI001045A2F9|nr:AfsR/SARP family transcriptional regulator [Micromonospora sp. 15K316]TDC38486.1 SARP family transcriptional regulator [Micromonospora sp. 15K316]
MTSQPAAPAVTFGVLGAVRADAPGGPVALRGARQRAVLARLLVARGRVVPVDRLLDALWAEPPEGGVAALRTFVADLRRALEPERPPRQPSRLLVTVPPGYALHPAAGAVDAWRFEAAVSESAELLTAGDAGAALARLDEGLALWRGPAYAEYAGWSWARAEIDRLDELRLLAVERRAEALLSAGRAAEAASDLRAHVADQPLREDAWRLLALALYRADRQGDALAALRRARETLVARLGVDPGPRLRQLEADVLAQAPHLAGPPAPATSAGPAIPAPVSRPAGSDARSARVAAPAAGEPVGGAGRRPLVGRDGELARLRQAAEQVAAGNTPSLALVSGDAGAGKSALAEALTGELAAAGWIPAWGRSPEYDGAPVAWPWRQIADQLTAATGAAPPTAEPEPAGGGGSDPAVARFRLHRAAAAQLTEAARRGPVLLVLDDLHRADEGTLDLLAALLTEPEPVTGPVLLVGTYRATEITPELTTALARFARTEPLRVYLGGLAEPATGELVRAVAGRDPDGPALRSIQRRSGGNPFFVRELARLLAAEGDAALERVPAGVRDVIRHRLTRLPPAAQDVLRQAAVLGRDVDPEVLAVLAGGDATVLDALDQALAAGFLTEQDGELRFTHVLVRDTIYGDLSAPRRTRWHTAAGAAIERLRPDDVVALAHHFGEAANRATAGRAGRYARLAAEQAERRAHPYQAVRLWQQAVDAHDRAGDADVRARLVAMMGLGRALAVTGHLDDTRRYRAEAIGTAETLDDPPLVAAVLTAFDVPAVWTRNDDEELSGRIVTAVDRTLGTVGADDPELRGRLLGTLALELRGTTGDRGRRAAVEAEAIARRLRRPALLAFALNARFMHSFERTGLAPQRARLGAELADLAARHELVTFEVLGHLVVMQASCALADLGAADAAAAAADRLADRHDLPLVGVFTEWYAALRLALLGRRAEAEAAYRRAAARTPTAGMPGMAEGLLPLALLSLRLADTPPGAPVPVPDARELGPYEPWARALELAAAGGRDEAVAALRTLPGSPHDLLREARLCLTARAALAVEDEPTIRYAYAELLPAAAELGGAGSGVLSLGPVARHLADLATALGRDEEAAAHDRTARALVARLAAAS